MDQRGLSEAPSRLNRGQARSHSGYVVCSLALAVSLAGCAGLPDQRLANEALKRGDTTLAAQNYQQLADLGYSEAQVGLADLQVDSRDPAQIKKRPRRLTAPRPASRRGLRLAWVVCWWPNPAPPKPNTKKPKRC